MKPFNITRILVLAVLIATSVAQFPVNFAAASVNKLPLPDSTSLSTNPGILALPPITFNPTPMSSNNSVTWYLHSATTTVGSYTYATINTSSPSGTARNMTAATTPVGVRVVSNTSSVSIFASNPVPAGYIWTLNGTWTFNIYTRPSSTGAGVAYFYARLYRIDTAGNLTWFDTSNSSFDVISGLTTYSLNSWNDIVSPYTLRAGERFGVEFLMYVTTALTGQTVAMGIDNSASQNSSVSVTFTETSVSAGGLVQDNYRIGNNRPLSAMTWKDAIDEPAINIPRNKNFRVRFQVENPGTAGKSWLPGLNWSTTSGSGYTVVPNTSSATIPFFVAPTDNFTNGDAISTAYFTFGNTTNTVSAGAAYDTQNPASANITLPGGNYTEIEFNVQANDNAVYGTTYYFRLTNNGTAFDAYDVTAAVVTIQLAPLASDPHNLYVSTTDKCAACHRAHTAAGKYLRKPASAPVNQTEQGLCLSCHDGTGAVKNINAEFLKTYTIPAGKVSHNLSLNNSTHSPYETAASSFNGTNRHVECEDCHRQHGQYPRTIDIGNGALSPNQYGTTGIGVNNTGINSTSANITYAWQAEASYEYEVCFKCHSGWAWGTSTNVSTNYGTSTSNISTPGGFWNSGGSVITANMTNIAAEFNTRNYSHHAVEGIGNNQPPLTANLQWIAGNWSLGLGNTFVPPWTATSIVKCSDCHGSDNGASPNGPHGSTMRWQVKPNLTGVGTAAVFCYNCHNREVYGDTTDYATTGNIKYLWTRFPHRWFLNERSDHRSNTMNRWGIWCMTCHGGDSLGGIHGSNKVGTGGTPMGKRLLNGAFLAGSTAGNTTTNSGQFYGKGATDAVNACNRHGGADGDTQWTANYNYAP